MLKKGAMFGLDARIALVIFGALSVISGAALYSAIQDAKAIALITGMKEIGKAWEAYYLDTGQIPRRRSTNPLTDDFYRVDTVEINTNSLNITGWKGPYFNASNHVLDYLQGIDWSDGYFNDGKCISGKECFLWVTASGFENNNIAKSIDKHIDGSDGPNTGDFRYWYRSDIYSWRHTLKYLPIKNPND